MDSAEMLRRQRELRRVWHELDDPPRRAVWVRRPNDEEILAWQGSDSGRSGPGSPQSVRRMGEICRAVVVGWRNFTQADLLGADQAPPDEQEFSPEIFAEWVQDHPGVAGDVANLALREFGKAKEAKAEASKNSQAS